MKYSKPSVDILGNASSIIEVMSLKDSGDFDNIEPPQGGGRVATAYDLDE